MKPITDELTQAIIADFEKEREELTEVAKAYEGNVRYFKSVFMSHQYLPVIATYDRREERFIELGLEVSGKGFVTIPL